MTDRDRARPGAEGLKGLGALDDEEADDYPRRIYEKLERDERLNYERIKIQDEIRQTVLSWGVAALAAIGAFLSGAAYLSYDRIIVSIAETIEQSLDDKVQVALDAKLDDANRQMETVFQRADEMLSREMQEVRDAENQVEATVIEARSAIASLSAQTEFVSSAAIKATDAALEATRAAEASQGRVGELDETVGGIRDSIEIRAAAFERSLERATDIQENIRGAITKLNDERASLSADIAAFERRLAVIEAKIAGLNGSLETAVVDQLREEEARLEAIQTLQIVFYVSRWNGGADVQRVIALHNTLVEAGVPNSPFATNDNDSFAAVTAEIDGDFIGVRRHLEGDRYQLFAAPGTEERVQLLIAFLSEVAPDIEITPVFEEFVVSDDKFRERPRGGLAEPTDVVLITKTPARTF